MAWQSLQFVPFFALLLRVMFLNISCFWYFIFHCILCWLSINVYCFYCFLSLYGAQSNGVSYLGGFPQGKDPELGLFGAAVSALGLFGAAVSALTPFGAGLFRRRPIRRWDDPAQGCFGAGWFGAVMFRRCAGFFDTYFVNTFADGSSLYLL